MKEISDRFFAMSETSRIILLAGASVSLLVLAISYWIIFEKAGEKGWKAIVPVYAILVWLGICGRPWWWIFFFPFAIPIVILMFDTARVFGKNVLFGLGLLLMNVLFMAILAFGGAGYKGPHYRTGE
ncbi:MAG TPA: DUF5684 domain-containing protein [Bacteroidia bacterium]